MALPLFMKKVPETHVEYDKNLASLVDFMKDCKSITVDINSCDFFFSTEIKMGEPFKENKEETKTEEEPYSYQETRSKTETYFESIQVPYDYQVKDGFLNIETFTRTGHRQENVQRTREVPYTYEETRFKRTTYKYTYEVTKQEKYRMRIDKFKTVLGYVIVNEKLVSKYSL